jgi:hypothetical protein
MNGIRILIALAAVALAAVVAAAPASPQSLGIGSPLLGDDGVGVNLPNIGGGNSGGSSGGGGGGGGGGSAATGNVTSGDTSADVDVACIEADVLDISAKVGGCDSGAGGGGGGAGGGGGDRGAADAEAGAGELGADAGVGCVDIGLGDLGDGLQIGSCEAIMPPAKDPGDEGSGELPAETRDGVAGAGAGGGGLGDAADCIAYDELSSAGTPYGIPPWLAGLVGVAMFGFGAFVARRRRPQAEDVAV